MTLAEYRTSFPRHNKGDNPLRNNNNNIYQNIYCFNWPTMVLSVEHWVISFLVRTPFSLVEFFTCLHSQEFEFKNVLKSKVKHHIMIHRCKSNSVKLFEYREFFFIVIDETRRQVGVFYFFLCNTLHMIMCLFTGLITDLTGNWLVHLMCVVTE